MLPDREFHRALTAWFDRAGRDLPWRRTRDPYAILVSEFMLQQTQVATVIPYYERWLARFPDAATLAAAPEAEVFHAWQGLGYYARARNLHRAAAQVAAAGFPKNLAEIRALPGVGRYTAGAVATLAFDQATPIVEANIARVLARLFQMEERIDSAAGNSKLWALAETLLPKRGAGKHNAALMELGALLCTPRRPRCAACPVARWCTATDPESLPRRQPRRALVLLDERCGFIRRDDEILLAQQTTRRWHGLWKLPLIAAPAADTPPLLEASYPFTHHRVRLAVFAADFSAATEPATWHRLDALEQLAMPSPHRRALAALLGKFFAGADGRA